MINNFNWTELNKLDHIEKSINKIKALAHRLYGTAKTNSGLLSDFVWKYYYYIQKGMSVYCNETLWMTW